MLYTQHVGSISKDIWFSLDLAMKVNTAVKNNFTSKYRWFYIVYL